jgi:hypothetical protein
MLPYPHIRACTPLLNTSTICMAFHNIRIVYSAHQLDPKTTSHCAVCSRQNTASRWEQDSRRDYSKLILDHQRQIICLLHPLYTQRPTHITLFAFLQANTSYRIASHHQRRKIARHDTIRSPLVPFGPLEELTNQTNSWTEAHRYRHSRTLIAFLLVIDVFCIEISYDGWLYTMK